MFYLVYVGNYGDLQWESDSTEILGLFKNKEKAIKIANEYINDTINKHEFVIDEECNNKYYEPYKQIITRLFWEEQENFGSSMEIIIQEIEVQ